MENLKKINDFHADQMATMMTCLSGKENKLAEDMVEEDRDTLIEENEAELEAYFYAEEYTGIKDNAEEALDIWFENLTREDVLAILKK